MTVVHVCPLSALDDVLSRTAVTRMISLSGPGKTPRQPSQIDRFFALEFNDINEPRDGLVAPDDRHIAQLLSTFASWGCAEPLLIHCWMGISRSTAAALLASAYFSPEQDMAELAAKLRTLSPMATPNPLMIALGDAQLGLDGRLASAVAQIGRGADAFEGQPFSMAL